MTGPRDLSPITVKYIRASANKAQLKTRTQPVGLAFPV